MKTLKPDREPCSPSPLIHQAASPGMAAYMMTGASLKLDANQALHHFSEPLSHVYFVQEGEIAGIIASTCGATRVLHLARKGSVVGEMFAFAEPPRPALGSLVATCATLVRAVPVDEFRTRVSNDPELARDLAASLSRKAVAYAKQVEDLCFRGVRRRLACVLLALFEASDNGRVCRLSQETLADMISAHRVTVTQTLDELQRMGIIGVGRRRIFLLDPGGLDREASATDR